jgi:hypothetical protein
MQSTVSLFTDGMLYEAAIRCRVPAADNGSQLREALTGPLTDLPNMPFRRAFTRTVASSHVPLPSFACLHGRHFPRTVSSIAFVMPSRLPYLIAPFRPLSSCIKRRGGGVEILSAGVHQSPGPELGCRT